MSVHVTDQDTALPPQPKESTMEPTVSVHVDHDSSPPSKVMKLETDQDTALPPQPKESTVRPPEIRLREMTPEDIDADPGLIIILNDEATVGRVIGVRHGIIPPPVRGGMALPNTQAVKDWVNTIICTCTCIWSICM